jgi:uncharacterized protein (DUF302 family)
LDQIELELRVAAEGHGGSVLAVSHVGQLLTGEKTLTSGDAVTVTLCFSDLYAPLLQAEIRFAVFLPSRIAACTKGDGVLLEAISPREYCRLLHRPDIEPLATALDDALRLVMEDAAHRLPHAAAEGTLHPDTEHLVNMRVALPQRIDCHGTKVEELAGTGLHDAPGA